MRILLILYLYLLSNITANKKERLMKKAMGNITDEDIMERLQVDRKKYAYYEKKMEYAKAMTNDNKYLNCETRKDYDIPEHFRFLPVLLGKLRQPGDKFTFSNHCFKVCEIKFEDYVAGNLKLGITVSEPDSLMCMDHMVISTPNIFKYEMIFSQGYHSVEIKVDEKFVNEIKIQGLRVFTLCTGIVETVKSFFTLIKFFFEESTLHDSIHEIDDIYFEDDITNSEREQKAVEFFKKYINVTLEIREGHETDVLDLENEIQSGDFFGSTIITHSFGIYYI